MEILETGNIPLSTSNPRGGINLHCNLENSAASQQSHHWTSGGRRLQFFYLAPASVLSLPTGRNFVKVITGRLDNIDRSSLAPPFSVRSTEVRSEKVSTREETALIALMTLTENAPEILDDITQLAFVGEACGELSWQTFHERFGAFLDAFEGQDCHMANGFHLLNENDTEVAYVNPWVCGKGVDLSTHNHANDPSPMAPAFAEVHWVLASGTQAGGMYETPGPGSGERTLHPMILGQEHGPFYDRDIQGLPIFRKNGTVQYPWHGWQGGQDDSPGQRYDYVWAFEINPDYVEACI